MRLPAVALILTIFSILGSVLPVDANPKANHVHLRRAPDPGSGSNETTTSTTASSTTSSSSISTTTSASSSTSSSTSLTPSTTTSSTTTSPFSSSNSGSSSSSTPSSSSATPTTTTSIQESSTSQATSSSTQSSQADSTSTSSSVASDPTLTSSSSHTQSRTTFTSTASNGSLFTVTAVVSSPSDGSGSGVVNTARQGFFANTGAVAGTFVVVGLIGTGLSVCVLLWALRRYRRRKRYQAYFDAEDKVFDQSRGRSGTPEAMLPDITPESLTPVPPSPIPNMIERLHGNAATIPNASHDPSLYQTEPGEFNPYQHHGGAYAYSDDQVTYGQYPVNSQRGDITYAYQPGTEFNNSTEHQAAREPSHAQQDFVVSS